jgi:hypothetical protein
MREHRTPASAKSPEAPTSRRASRHDGWTNAAKTTGETRARNRRNLETELAFTPVNRRAIAPVA